MYLIYRMSIEENNSSKGTDLETDVFFSIIVPVYNSGKTLRYCMDSILNQSYENYEVILVDDGSNDNSWSLCEIFQAENSKVKVFHTENHGVSHARNYALNNVRGKYAVFVDSDDYIDEYFLEKVYENIDNRTQLVIVGIREIENERVIKESSYHKLKKNISKIEFLQGIFEKDMFGGYIWNKVFDLSIIKTNHLSFNETISICEDTMFCFVYANYVDNARIIDEPLYMYIRHHDSAIHMLERKKVLSEELVADELYYNREQHSDLKLTELMDLYCCDRYLNCIYKADFKNGIYDKKHIDALMAKMEQNSIKSGEMTLKLRFILLRYMPRVAYLVYRAIRVIRHKSVSGERI